MFGQLNYRVTLAMVVYLLLATSCTVLEKSMQKSSRSGSFQEQSTLNGDPSSEPSELKSQIQDLERKLETRKEKEQYSKLLPWLRDDQEKIDFLKQPNLEKRNKWALEKKVFARPQYPSPEMKRLIDNQDIALGMPMDYVSKSWGEPSSKDVSGNPLMKNERWRYNRTISSSDGYRQEKRFVYFEAGKVVGWETE